MWADTADKLARILVLDVPFYSSVTCAFLNYLRSGSPDESVSARAASSSPRIVRTLSLSLRPDHISVRCVWSCMPPPF